MRAQEDDQRAWRRPLTRLPLNKRQGQTDADAGDMTRDAQNSMNCCRNPGDYTPPASRPSQPSQCSQTVQKAQKLLAHGPHGLQLTRLGTRDSRGFRALRPALYLVAFLPAPSCVPLHPNTILIHEQVSATAHPPRELSSGWHSTVYAIELHIPMPGDVDHRAWELAR